MTQDIPLNPEELGREERRRLDRQLRLPGWNQQLLKQSTVLILGVGGLGVEVAKNLAMVGVGRLILVDMDTIEFSNLNRQVLFIGAEEGEPKAVVAARRLRELNPFVQVDAYHSALQDLDPAIYEEADLYVAGLDNVTARKELNRRAIHFNKPMIDAGTSNYNGHVYCVFPFQNACLECDPMQERAAEELGACTLVGEPRKKIHCVLKGLLKFESEHGQAADIHEPKELAEVLDYANQLMGQYFPHENPYTEDQVIQTVDRHEPTVITINAVMASLQSQEAVKILHNRKEPFGTINLHYIIYNGLTGKFFELEKPVNPKCELCGPGRVPIHKIKVPKNLPLQEVLGKIFDAKGYTADPDFPPNVFRLDSSDELVELDLNQTVGSLGLRNFETLLVSGLDDDRSFYLQFKIA